MLGIRYVGKLKYSFGVSIASIGDPAVILPRSGTCTTSSFKYSLLPTISNDLYLELVFLIYPLDSSAVMCDWIVAGEFNPNADPISLTAGGKPWDAT